LKARSFKAASFKDQQTSLGSEIAGQLHATTRELAGIDFLQRRSKAAENRRTIYLPLAQGFRCNSAEKFCENKLKIPAYVGESCFCMSYFVEYGPGKIG